MKRFIILGFVLLVSWNEYNVIAFNLPGPRVYVVTPSPRPLQIDKGTSVPFYYHEWMRRMDNDVSVQNSTTTTVAPIVKTPDLIFAEFESDSNDSMKKSIRKLLEKEKVVPKIISTTTTTTSTTSRPIYVPDDDFDEGTSIVNYGLPVNVKQPEKDKVKPSDNIDYFSMYNKLHENDPLPVFSSSTTQSTTTSTTPDSNKIENIWHIIDSEKTNQYSGTWNEVPVKSNKESQKAEHKLTIDEDKTTQHNGDDDEIDENYALPGLGTNPGNGGENESRAIRTDQNIRFPYVDLKTFQLKPNRQPLDKTNNLMTNLDNFHEIKNPVRGEAHDVLPVRGAIDRYNPAIPYFPPKDHVSKFSKQNSFSSPPKATANLVPPPPLPPKLTNNDFPVLTNYESFPPYDSPSFGSLLTPAPPSSTALKPSKPMFSPPTVDVSNDFDSNVDSDNLSNIGPPTNVRYQYNPPSPAVQKFIPTSPPITKPFNGYSYDKPLTAKESPMMPSMESKPDFQGYLYSKPDLPPNDPGPSSFDHHGGSPSYGHEYPELMFDKHHDDMDDSKGNSDIKGMLSPPPPDTKTFDHGPPIDDHDISSSYGPHDASPSLDHDYPELIFQKHHGDMDDSNGSNDMKGMVPPPPADMKPSNGPLLGDHGFPSDFPSDFKYHHDFDDHDFYHHHHHHHPTTTTTEMPRVNRYSYYYLGKKLYYLPLYFSVYFVVYVGALVIKAVLRHKIVYPNSWRPNDMTAGYFSKRSVDGYLSNDNLHEVTGKVTHAIATAAEKYINAKSKNL